MLFKFMAVTQKSSDRSKTFNLYFCPCWCSCISLNKRPLSENTSASLRIMITLLTHNGTTNRICSKTIHWRTLTYKLLVKAEARMGGQYALLSNHFQKLFQWKFILLYLQIYEWLHGEAAKHSQMMEMIKIGQSWEKRPIYVTKVSVRK